MLDQKQFTIEGSTFTLQQFNTTTGLEVGTALLKILAGAAEGIGETFTGSFLDVSFNPGKLAAGCMNRLDVQGTPQLIKRMIQESVVLPEYSDEWFESEFSGGYDKLYRMLQEIIELNRYGDLLKKVLPEVMGLISSDIDTQAQE